MKFIGIIPARYASSRFPGKPLADICGMTMIERVYRRASMELDEVYVATDDDRIAETVKGFGGRVVMTAATHRSGTDRCYEAYCNIGSDADVVINIQGDEPFIDPSQIAEVKRCFDDESTRIATLVRKFDPALGFEALFDANTPKVTFDDNMNALYFSRSIIPYVRNFKWQEWIDRCTFYTHVGMYAYR
ncbi:3-deoxy-manno-octulosonate cytidylyltransferase, partial [uncultured Muribaculum sp.]